MNLVVLGGGGFIGSCIHQMLIHRQMNGIFISRSFCEGYNWRGANIITKQSDINSMNNIYSAIEGEVDILYMANTPSLASYELISTSRWTEGIERMVRSVDELSQLSNAKIKSVGLISSAGTVYGSSKDEQTIESKLQPKSFYGLYHCLAEQTLQFWCKRKGIDCKIMRVTNPYGRTQIGSKRKGLIVSLLKTIENGNCLELRGNGQQVRDYIYADDLGDTVIDIMIRNGSSTTNVCSGYTASGIDIVEAIKKVTGKTPLYKLSPIEYDYEVSKNIVAPVTTETVLGRGGYLNLEQGIERVYVFKL